jgi:hypothetical protein
VFQVGIFYSPKDTWSKLLPAMRKTLPERRIYSSMSRHCFKIEPSSLLTSTPGEIPWMEVFLLELLDLMIPLPISVGMIIVINHVLTCLPGGYVIRMGGF